MRELLTLGELLKIKFSFLNKSFMSKIFSFLSKVKNSKVVKFFFMYGMLLFILWILDRHFSISPKLEVIDKFLYLVDDLKYIDHGKENTINKHENLINIKGFNLKGGEVKFKNSKSEIRTFYLYIDEEIYEKEFFGISPIDRCKLSGILDGIKKLKPKAVVIDIDLTPLPNILYKDGRNSVQSTDIAHKRLFKHYAQCEKNLSKVINNMANEGITMILLESGLKDRVPQSFLDSGRIKFGISTVNLVFGIPYTYNLVYESKPTFGGVLFQSMNVNQDQLNINEFHIFYNKFQFQHIQNNNDLKNSIVFLGSFVGDEYITPLRDRTPGVIIHLLGYLTIKNFHENLTKFRRFIIEILPFLGKLTSKALSLLFGYIVSMFIESVAKFLTKINEQHYFRRLALIGLSILTFSSLMFIFANFFLSIQTFLSGFFLLELHLSFIIFGLFFSLIEKFINKVKK